MDASKAEKLAAAKKKLKQFQQKGGPKGSANGGQVNLQHQTAQGEVNQSPPLITTTLNNELEEQKANLKVQHEEKYICGNAKELELQQVIESLGKEKNDILSSYMKSKDLAEELQLKLNQERILLKEEKEKSVRALETISVRSLHEEQLKNTVSILIEEKNELAVSNAQNEEKAEKLEESKIDQKKELEDTKTTLSLLQFSAAEETTKLQSCLSSLTSDLQYVGEELKLKDQLYNEVNEELKEFQMRHSIQTAELSRREDIINELNLQMELLSVNMQQLKNAGPPTVDQSLERMQKGNEKLQEEVKDLLEQIKTLSIEKDVLSQQYQQYILRLNGQIRTISSQAETLATEKRNAEATLEAKKDELAELESKIAALKMEREAVPLSRSSYELAVPSETHIYPQPDSQLDEEIATLKSRISELDLNNEELVKLAMEKESRIQELEIRIDRMQTELNIATTNQDLGEREKLLQVMQSDKSTASRAIGQNRQLKLQLEELEKAFIQLSNDKLVLTEESQTVDRQNKEMKEKLQLLEPEVTQLRQQVDDLAGQRNATVYWRQELEEAHERIQALSHQNAELKKRVIWKINEAPVRGSRKQRHNDEETNEDRPNSHSSSESEGDSDWIPAEEHQKLLFHFGQLEQRLERSIASVSSLTEEKQKLDHLVLQLQSETETIGEYVSLYQVQRGQLSRRAEQLSAERQKLKERIVKLTGLLPRLAPQLKKLPQWLQLQPEPETIANSEDGLTITTHDLDAESDLDFNLEYNASQIIDVLKEITDCALPKSDIFTKSDICVLEQGGRKPNENFHPCWPMYSGRVINI